MLNIQIVKLERTKWDASTKYQLVADVTMLDEVNEIDEVYSSYSDAIRALNRLTLSILIDADAGYYDSEGN
jgi:hypothetical protein